MDKSLRMYRSISRLITSVLIIILVAGSVTVFGQQAIKERPDKPQIQSLPGLHVGEANQSSFQSVPSVSFNNSSEMGYWSHITTGNTGNVPFRTAGNYVFVDSKDRLFTVSGGLFVWNGAYWRELDLSYGGITPGGVREIAEHNDGSLWLGTSNGLVRLNSDLQVQKIYTTENSNLKKNDIGTLLIEDDGSIWAGHRWHEENGGGTTILHERIIEDIGGYTSDIIQRSNGDIWIAESPSPQGDGGQIYVYRPSNDSSWSYTEDNSGLPHNEVDNFTEDSQGNLWMGLYTNEENTMGGVVKYDGSSWTYYDQSDGLPQEGAWYIHAASDDKIYYGTADSMMVYDNGSWNHFTNNNDRFPLLGVSSMTEDVEGNLVLGASSGTDLTGAGVHIYDGSSWEYVSTYTDGGLFSQIIFGADVDTEGNLWLSGFYGATMFDGEKWTYFNTHDGMAYSYAWKLLAASDGTVWFTTGNGPTQYKDGQFTTFENEDFMSVDPFVEAAFEDSQGNIWFAAYSNAGVLKYDGTTFTHYGSDAGLAGTAFTAFGEDASRNIYVSSNQGVYTFNGSNWSEFSVDGQTGVRANEMASDADGNLWIDTNRMIKMWDGSTWSEYTQEDGYMGWTTHIEPADDGSIWLAGYKVQVIRDGKFFDMTPSAEYSGYSSYVITHDDNGTTWVGTYNNGLFKYEMSEGLAIESIVDYPDDQGGWVTLNATGFLMDPYRISDNALGSMTWEVQRKNGDRWESAGSSSEFNGMTNQKSVQVPTTMSTGEDLAENKYVFRVGVFSTTGDVLGYSDPDTAFALDNLAPSAVTGVTANRGTDQVNVSWNAPEDNDVASYEIVPADDIETPLVTTQQTSLTLSDADYSGIQQLLVRARDIHANASASSEKTVAIFPVDLNYDVRENWNLVGLPLDADPADIDAMLSQVSEDALYEYNGSYEPVETIEPGKGYWAKFPASESYQLTGLPLAEQTLELKSGWNLISGLGASFDYSQIHDPNGILIEGGIAGFDGSYTEIDVLAPGSGYWIRTSEAGSITLSLLEESSEVLSKKMSPLTEAKSQLNKITVQSSEGYQNTLYFGEKLPKQVDPLSFSLPPVPPGGGFDIRFAGEDTRYSEANTFTLNLQKAFHSELTLSLDLLSTHPHQSYSVQELKGTKVLAEYTLDNETKVQLRNSGATALKVTPAGMSDFTDDLPAQFTLSPSYPNPFNPSTNIQYELPQQVAVNLEVYNMIGRKVSTLLANQQQEAGVHTVRFDASALSSGMYFVRLKAGSFEQIQKITLIK